MVPVLWLAVVGCPWKHVLGPIVHLVWLAFPNFRLWTRVFRRRGYSQRVLLGEMRVSHLLMMTCRILRISSSLQVLHGSANLDPAMYQRKHRPESGIPYPPPSERSLQMVRASWSSLSVTPTLSFCWDAGLLLEVSNVSGAAAILSFEPHQILFLPTASLAVLLVFCFL